MFYFWVRVAPLGLRRSRWLSSTIVAASLISACGTAEAQETPGQPAPNQPTPSQPTQSQATPSQPTPGPTTPGPTTPGQANPNLPPVTVIKPVKRPAAAKPTREGPAGGGVPRQAQRVTQRPRQPAPTPQAPSTQAATPQAPSTQAATPQQVAPGTPGPNLNAVAPSATRLGLPLLETPASVEVVDQRTIQDQATGPPPKSPKARSVYWTSILPGRRPTFRCEASPSGQ
jgi:hypothetical protein